MTAPFYNPFKNWPFAITPGGNGTLGTPIECSCEVIDGKHYRHDGYQCPAENIRQPSPDRQFTKTPPQHAGFKEGHDGQHHEDASKAIEALKALKVSQVASATKHQKPAGKENTGSGPANQGSNNENMPKSTSYSPATTEDQIDKRGTMKQIFGDSTNQHKQALMDYRSLLSAPSALGMNNKWSGVSNLPNTFTPMPPVPEFMENPPRDSKGKAKALWSAQGGHIPSQFLDIPSRSKGPPPSPQKFQATGIFDDNDPCTPKGRGKIVVGCSQCRFHPIIKAIPCGCCMCYDCCGQFCTSVTSGSIVYCECGEVNAPV